MQWQDEGVILHTQGLGENKYIISLFTPQQGRSSGLLRPTKKSKAWMQCGNKVKARWGARLESHLGFWTLEPLENHTAFLLDEPGPLAALLSASALCHLSLPERHPYPELYQCFEDFLLSLRTPEWASTYVFFEIALLEYLGYGLELNTCAVTGTTEDLVAVSPRTARAVSASVATPYKDKLLPLPSFLIKKEEKNRPKPKEILDALVLSGYFLERHLLGRELPSARKRLLQKFTELRKTDDCT